MGELANTRRLFAKTVVQHPDDGSSVIRELADVTSQLRSTGKASRRQTSGGTQQTKSTNGGGWAGVNTLLRDIEKLGGE